MHKYIYLVILYGNKNKTHKLNSKFKKTVDKRITYNSNMPRI